MEKEEEPQSPSSSHDDAQSPKMIVFVQPRENQHVFIIILSKNWKKRRERRLPVVQDDEAIASLHIVNLGLFR